MTESETICVMEPDKREHRQGGARRSGTSTSSRHSKPGKKPRRRWKQLTGGEKALRVLIIIAAVLAVLFVAVAVATRLIFVKPTIPDTPSIPISSTDPELNIPGPKLSGDRKKNFFTFLVIGRDTGGGGNTDTLMLAAYDVNNQKLNVMSIPRDTMVNVSWDIKKINSVYNVYGGGDKGIEALGAEISQLVGFVPDYQIVVEWDAVGQLVDAIGGVYFDVPIDMNYDDPAQDLSIHINKGYQHLDGEAAMGVVRYRHDNESSPNYKANQWYTDVQRGEFQREVLITLAKKVISWNSLTKVTSFLDIFNSYVETNLSLTDMAYFAEQAMKLDLSTAVQQGSLTGRGDGVLKGYKWGSSWNYFYEAEDILPTLNALVNPYTRDLTEDDLDLPVADRYTQSSG